MSAVLQRGDRIYLAVPYHWESGWTPEEHKQAAERAAAEQTSIFAQMGVSVLFWCANQNTVHPYVVAVFRD